MSRAFLHFRLFSGTILKLTFWIAVFLGLLCTTVKSTPVTDGDRIGVVMSRDTQSSQDGENIMPVDMQHSAITGDTHASLRNRYGRKKYINQLW